jgi:hypothetical protein
MDAGGGTIVLANLAVHATIAILDANEVIIHDPAGALLGNPETRYYHQTPDPNRLPALVVQGDLRMCIRGRGTLTLNDKDGTTQVKSSLNGVFYCTGTFKGPQLDASQALDLDGAIIASDVKIYGDTLRIRHDPRLNTTPLAELSGTGLRPVPGTAKGL